ncbi:tetratricopeptide repeat protein [Flavobacterium sp. K77]|uniref:tetratricopeptide repeat protein n=1 Tax=Flavobacterium sp. K77 TaxID=2910676 RepID=UPI001F37768E|nr:tetratricopeptide repeat protein [Flavobacterium sp. K77]MCF6142369.1 tetratricopeptide repeat protein [Flavobacterium sp. K77]
MTSNVPTVRQFAWVSLVPHYIFMGLIIFVYHLLGVSAPFLYGMLTYLIISFGLRNLIAKDHQQGLKLVKRQQFETALPLFEKSVDFFSENNWVDKYRFLTLLSSSKMSYKEMGLCNIAFCYSQTSNGQKAIEYYEQTLKEFPENGLAMAGLKMLNSMGQTAKVGNEN